MQQYNPKAPNELADAQLNRAQHESEKSKAIVNSNIPQSESNEYLYGANPVKHDSHSSNGAVLDRTEQENSNKPTNKESYNSIPGE